VTRTFVDQHAVREKTPLLVGTIGPSGVGKTFSMLRLATGIQRVAGGDIFVIDTEARRSLHYADRFRFRHVPFGPPFSPLDYLAAIEHCVAKGAGVIVVDSMSHEHDGPGGVLEMYDAEFKRMGGKQTISMLAWQKPKQQRRRLINAILQIPCNFLFGFRAKEKLKIVAGEDPIQLGFQPIAGDEFVYELTTKFLLLPGANGVPTWQSEMPGERVMIKKPEQFKDLFAKPAQLSEDLGEQLARWAAGAPRASAPSVDALLAEYASCSDPATLRTLADKRQAIWGKLPENGEAREKLKAAFVEAKARVAEAVARTFEDDGSDDAAEAAAEGKAAG